MERESTRHEVPTLRDYATDGGGGPLADCTSESEKSPPSAEMETERGAETEPTSTGETDTTDEVRIEPIGSLILEEVPGTRMTLTGLWAEAAIALGQREGVELAGWCPPAYFFDRRRVADSIDRVFSR